MYETAMKIIGDMPLNEREPLLELLSSDVSPSEFSAAVLNLEQLIDLSKYRREIAEALIEATGICDAVPEVYEDFRPVVYDGAFFILTGISQARLLRIINAQFLTGMGASPGERLIALVRDIPMLYKLGQIMARNPHIDEQFRHWLTLLEGGLIHIDISTIRAIIEQEIGAELHSRTVVLSDSVISEASVASVVSFTLQEAEAVNKHLCAGVFKVIKPDVPGFLDEDMKLLDALAEFYTKNRGSYALGDFKFTDTFKDVKYALSKEADLRNEQRNMRLAGEFYRHNRRIIIPQPQPFSTKKVTAMQFIDGKKITEMDTDQKQCAVELFNAIVTDCLFADAVDSLFHGDPHAGNILIVKDARMGFRIALVDWSQAGTLTKTARASVLKLASGIITNNHSIILDAVNTLSEGGIGGGAALSAVIDELSKPAPGTTGGIMTNIMTGIMNRALNLLDRLVLRGVKFPADLLLFRKAVFTLNGVLLSLDPEFDQDSCLINYMFRLLAEEMPQRWFNVFFPYADSPFNYRSLMSNAELFTLGVMLMTTRLRPVF
ncbi:AarF/UbiB family protein [Candidatus Magnetominusculus xianensis]|uniref:ABC transporter n=1 Tax=Candidatus Magnetominusculus xianensis TaxID=1748249 RepID=A0ABR5SF97_9BACT|nr:AarF/UbiB family protein [Candidatus Magnetominusculus xianensis]KWT85881.1 ABC transporter [Candidatus Magnetominusculus xianensis]MBF0403554.1 hypothetical protein [Nitrospirota bacterium]